MKKLLVFGLFTTLFLSSCLVGKKKFDASLLDNQTLQAENELLLTRLDEQTKENVDLDIANQQLRETINGLKGDTTKANQQIRDLQQMYQELNSKNKQDLARTAMENQQLQAELAQRKRELEDKEAVLNTLQKQLEEREARLNELQALLAAKDKAIQDLKKSIEDALLNFNADELTVEMRDGKIYVSLAEQLLFQSGSTVVDPKGIDALKKLAAALKSQPDIDILIEGHTDSIPISTARIKDNWDLSVLRATSIVRILTEAGISADQVVPSGRGEFVPVATNKTKEGRASNRRIEIILSPNLDEIFKILEGN